MPFAFALAMPPARRRRPLPRPATARRAFNKVRGLGRSSGSARCNRLHQRHLSQLDGSLFHAGSATRVWERGRRLRALARPPQQNLQVGNQASAHKTPARADDTDKHSPASPPLASPPVAAPCARPEHVRQKRLELHNREMKERQTLTEQYKATGDLSVFSSILSPFLPQAELGEWQWNDEVEWWWREDKTTGQKLWAPMEHLFS